MCGIIGIVSRKTDVLENLMYGLKHLEYRGYDSAGIAFLNSQKKLISIKSVGKVKALADRLRKISEKTKIGIGHTRWATHGKANEINAHPHVVNDLAIVHNGVIENYLDLRNQLLSKGKIFLSETDSEVIVQLINDFMDQTKDLIEAINLTIQQLRGSYAFVILSAQNPNTLIAVKNGNNPIVIGLGEKENYLASDANVLLKFTNRFIWLENGNIAVITDQKVDILGKSARELASTIKTLKSTKIEERELGLYDHYMQKEIFEQPTIFRKNIAKIKSESMISRLGIKFEKILPQIQHIQIVACGSSYYAALVGKYWLENLGILTQVEIASEYRYRKVVVLPNTLFITLSQSGETADVIAALQKAKNLAYLTSLTFCNVKESTIVHESEHAFFIRAGKEIGVASTKAFTAILCSLWFFSQLYKKTPLDFSFISTLPNLATQILNLEPEIIRLAKHLKTARSIFYLGRGLNFPIALEGALKLKELAYVHAEAYPGGELKHGPLALIEDKVPVVALLPNDELQEKLVSNLQEISSRGGKIILFADENLQGLSHKHWYICSMPSMPAEITPILYTIGLQLLAYHVALLKKTEIDQPRNLAKSVTVE